MSHPYRCTPEPEPDAEELRERVRDLEYVVKDWIGNYVTGYWSGCRVMVNWGTWQRCAVRWESRRKAGRVAKRLGAKVVRLVPKPDPWLEILCIGIGDMRLGMRTSYLRCILGLDSLTSAEQRRLETCMKQLGFTRHRNQWEAHSTWRKA